MRRVLRTLAACGITTSAVLVSSAGANPTTEQSAQSARAALRLVRLQPLSVRGIRFEAGEVVRVTATGYRERLVKKTRAGDAGTFVVGFRMSASLGPCNSQLSVSAVGSRGSRATLRLPQIACPPTR